MKIYKYEVYFRQVFSLISRKKSKHGKPFRLAGMLFKRIGAALARQTGQNKAEKTR